MSFGKRLRDRRKELGYSQGELAEKLGVSRQTINAIENDNTTRRSGWPSSSRLYSASR